MPKYTSKPAQFRKHKCINVNLHGLEGTYRLKQPKEYLGIAHINDIVNNQTYDVSMFNMCYFICHQYLKW